MPHKHDEILAKVKQTYPAEKALSELADLFKIFGDTTRIKIMYSLLDGEMCVCSIAELIGMAQPAVSHQLRVLKNAKLVSNHREGKTIYYFLSDDHVKTIVACGFEHLMEQLKHE